MMLHFCTRDFKLSVHLNSLHLRTTKSSVSHSLFYTAQRKKQKFVVNFKNKLKANNSINISYKQNTIL